MTEIKDKIIESVKKATGEKEINLEIPEIEDFGDYSTNISLILAKEKKKIPGKAAEEILSELQTDKGLLEIVKKVEIAGAGFVNFWLKDDVLVDTLKQIDADFGKSGIGKGKTVVIDYSSPNIAKPFGVGHLRSTIIGQALYNLYKYLGYEVIGDNHLGDWGTQFGKLIYMIKKEGVKEFDIDKLEQLYTEFHKLAGDPAKAEEMESGARAWFKKLEDGDPEAKKVWQKCVDVSVAEFDRIYDMLGVKIDFTFGESYYQSEMRQMVGDSEIKKHLTKGEDGALVIDLTKQGIKTPLMFLKSDGATTYATRDLATIKFRVRKWDPAIMIYEVGAEQNLHFQQVFAAARLLGLVGDSVKLVHTSHGLYLGPDGKKFSTRHGKTIKLEEVLNEAIVRAKKLGNDKIDAAREVGIGAIKYFDLMHSVESNVVFDWDKMMNLEGNSGPYLQYTVARCNSVLSKAGGDKKSITEAKKPDLDESELAILRSLIKFSDVLETSAESFAPNLLCNYLYELASKYNSFYNKDKIIGSEKEEFRLALTFSVGQVLKNGLKILGIETPEKM
jgi:arginyl-tRNA synthetase